VPVGQAPGAGDDGGEVQQAGDGIAAAAQLFQFGVQRLAFGLQFVQSDPMLARQLVPVPELRVQLGDLGRVQFDAVLQMAQLRQRFLQLHVGRFQQAVHLGQTRVAILPASDLRHAGAQQGQSRRAVFAIEQAGGRGAGGQQLAGLALALVPGHGGFDVLGFQRLPAQFRHLVLQVVDAFADVAAALQFVQRLLARQPMPVRGTHRLGLGLALPEGVQQAQLLPALEQALLLVLAVDLQQQAAEFAQLRGGGGAAVDPGLGAAVGADHPPQLAGVAVVELVLPQPGQGFGRVLQAEFGAEFGAFGAMPDHARFGARAAQAQQGVHQQGFAGAGLAGDHGEAGRQRQAVRRNHREVRQCHVRQHAAILPDLPAEKPAGFRIAPGNFPPRPCHRPALP